MSEEVTEHLHHAQDPFDKRVAGSMAIMAALLAIVSVLGQHFNTEKLLNQQLSSDQWAFYQAKDIRRYTAQMGTDLMRQLHADDQLSAKYAGDSVRYRNDTQQILEKARDFEKERDDAGRIADFFHFSEVFLEAAIVLSSLAILTKRKILFTLGLAATITGISIAVLGSSGHIARLVTQAGH